MEKPIITDFGLPADYDVEARSKAYDRQHKIAARNEVLSFFVGGWLGDLLFVFAVGFFGGSLNSVVIVAIPVIFFVAGLMSARSTANRGSSDQPRDEEYANLLGFSSALGVWEDSLETGAGYWRRRSGKRFGQSIRRFLSARGCETETLEVGHGQRLDMIVSVGSRRFYCVCDGSSDGSSADAIREAAEMAEARELRLLLFYRSHYPGDVVGKLGVTAFCPEEIARLAAADRFLVPRPRRSAIGRILHRHEGPEILADWPVRPQETS